MNLDARGVQRDGFDLDAHDLRALQLLEHAIEHAGLGPAVHARVDRVPIAKPLGQPAPLAAMLGHIEDRVDHLQVAQADVAALRRQAMFDGGKLLGRDLHTREFPPCHPRTPVVLTRPRQNGFVNFGGPVNAWLGLAPSQNSTGGKASLGPR